MQHSVKFPATADNFKISRSKESIVGNNTLGEVRNHMKDKVLQDTVSDDGCATGKVEDNYTGQAEEYVCNFRYDVRSSPPAAGRSHSGVLH